MLFLANSTPSNKSFALPESANSAAVLMTTKFSMGFEVSNSPLSSETSVAAFSDAVPPLTDWSGLEETPNEDGEISSWLIRPSRSSHTFYKSMTRKKSYCQIRETGGTLRDCRRTNVGPSGLISSNPSAPLTTQALLMPKSFNAVAKMDPKDFEWTPTIMTSGLAGLMRGPRTLKTVRKPRVCRIGAKRAIAG